jgi:hypothetical protein
MVFGSRIEIGAVVEMLACIGRAASMPQPGEQGLQRALALDKRGSACIEAVEV